LEANDARRCQFDNALRQMESDQAQATNPRSEESGIGTFIDIAAKFSGGFAAGMSEPAGGNSAVAASEYVRGIQHDQERRAATERYNQEVDRAAAQDAERAAAQTTEPTDAQREQWASESKLALYTVTAHLAKCTAFWSIAASKPGLTKKSVDDFTERAVAMHEMTARLASAGVAHARRGEEQTAMLEEMKRDWANLPSLVGKYERKCVNPGLLATIEPEIRKMTAEDLSGFAPKRPTATPTTQTASPERLYSNAQRDYDRT